MDKPVRLVTLDTQDTICVVHHYTQINTNNVNKTLALRQSNICLTVQIFVDNNKHISNPRYYLILTLKVYLRKSI